MSDHRKYAEKYFNSFIQKQCQESNRKLIEKFLKKIRHIPLFWATFSDELKEVYEAIDEIRDYYQKVIKE